MGNIFLHILLFPVFENSYFFLLVGRCHAMCIVKSGKLFLQRKHFTVLTGPAKKDTVKIRALGYEWGPTCLKNWKDYALVFRVLPSLENFLGLGQLCDASAVREALLRLRVLGLKVPCQVQVPACLWTLSVCSPLSFIALV